MRRPLAGQAAALTVLLAGIAAANLTAGVAARLAPTVSAGVELGEVLLHLLLIPVFLVWFYRARKNADGRGQDQRLGPGWAIGAWFVPVIWLWFPYQMMADIWRANLPAERRAKRAWLPGFWWTCFVAGNIFGIIAFEVKVMAPTRAAFSQSPPVVFIPYFILLAAAAILLIVIVRVITRGPVGREPMAAQPSLAPQDGVVGPGLVYPQVPADDAGGHLAASVGYALSALAVLVAATLTAGGIYGQSIRTTPATAPTPVPASAPAPTPTVESLTFEQLRAGDCLQGPADLNTGSTWPDTLPAVPCAKRHIAEVFYSANYWPDTMAFPRNSVIFSQSRKKCLKAFRAYDGGPYSASQYSYYYLAPQGRSDWDSGDRQLVCVAYLTTSAHPRGVPMYGSIKGTAR